MAARTQEAVEFETGRLDTTPEAARYNPERLERLDEAYGRLIGTGRVQAAGYLMARDGKIFAHRMGGRLTHREDSPAAGPDSIKRIASISKVITAGIVMKLVEDGVLWLEQPVKTVLPEFDNPVHGGITLLHLLTHSSGLAADPGYFSEPYPADDRVFNPFDHDDWLRRVLTGPLQSQPGERWSYCSLAFSLLAEIASRASGRNFYDLVTEEIFRPLRMDRSFYDLPAELESELMTCAEWDLEQLARSRKRSPNRCPNGGGGVYSTLYDLFRYGQCFLNKGELDGVRFLGRTTVEAMTKNWLERDVTAFHWGKRCKTYRQGLGWEFYADGPTMNDAAYNHEGWGWCSLYVDPREAFVFVSFVGDYSGWDPDVMVKPRTIAWSGLL